MKTNFVKLCIVAILFLLVGFIPSGFSFELVMQPGPDEGKDTFIWEREDHFSDGYPDYNYIEVGGWGSSFHSYLQFDISSLPIHATLAKIELYLFPYPYPPPDDKEWGPPPPIELYKVTGSWEEETNCWNNRPTLEYLRTLDTPEPPPPDGGFWYTIDITDLYNEWAEGRSVNFGISLSPEVIGNRFAVFRSSDYLDNPSLRPKLIIEYTVSIDNIQDFIDGSVSSGAMAGAGNGNSANNRLNALSNMLSMADELININDIEGACRQLNAAYKKCDGESRPPDFVEGDAVLDLSVMITELMEELECE